MDLHETCNDCDGDGDDDQDGDKDGGDVDPHDNDDNDSDGDELDLTRYYEESASDTQWWSGTQEQGLAWCHQAPPE